MLAGGVGCAGGCGAAGGVLSAVSVGLAVGLSFLPATFLSALTGAAGLAGASPSSQVKPPSSLLSLTGATGAAAACGAGWAAGVFRGRLGDGHCGRSGCWRAVAADSAFLVRTAVAAARLAGDVVHAVGAGADVEAGGGVLGVGGGVVEGKQDAQGEASGLVIGFFHEGSVPVEVAECLGGQPSGHAFLPEQVAREDLAFVDEFLDVERAQWADLLAVVDAVVDFVFG